ncbi:MAG TPA: hypothetical protein VFT50_02750 [Baekduia sp.]|nr:hypothetical protein [Baekduia sp.]
MSFGQLARDWAPVASTSFAAVAATVAWANVRQSRRHWLLAQQPALVPQVVDHTAEARIELHLLNAGAGSARGLQFCLVLGDEYVAGYAGPNLGGLLKSDETRVVKTQLTARTGSPLCVVTCLDSVGRVHVFDLQDRHEILGTGRSHELKSDPIHQFARRYPDTDVREMTKVAGAALAKKTKSP